MSELRLDRSGRLKGVAIALGLSFGVSFAPQAAHASDIEEIYARGRADLAASIEAGKQKHQADLARVRSKIPEARAAAAAKGEPARRADPMDAIRKAEQEKARKDALAGPTKEQLAKRDKEKAECDAAVASTVEAIKAGDKVTAAEREKVAKVECGEYNKAQGEVDAAEWRQAEVKAAMVEAKKARRS